MKYAFSIVVLALALLGACYSPELDPCAVRCSTGNTCPNDTSCGADKFCHAAGEPETCREQRHVMVSLSGTGGGQVSTADGEINCQPDCEATIPDGTAVTLTAAPNAASRFAGWTGGCTGTGPCTVTIAGDLTLGAQFTTSHSLTLTFAGAGTGHVTSAPAGLDCTTGCTTQFDDNPSVTLTMAPDVGSRFVTWTGECASAGTNPTCNVTVDHSVNVGVQLVTSLLVTVTPTGTGVGTVTSTPSGITCGATCMQRFDSGTAITLTATVAGANRFAGWLAGGACGGTATNPCVISSLDVDTTAIPIFNAQRDLTVNIVGSGSVGGDVTCAAATCVDAFDLDTMLSLTASPSAGWRFGGWSMPPCAATTGTCDLTLSADSTVTATFIELHDLSIDITGMGTVSADVPPSSMCTANCTLVEDHDTVVTLTAAPMAGWRFGGWGGGTCTGMGTCVVTMSSAKTVTALFVQTFTLTVVTAGNGSITSNVGGINCPGTCSATIDDGTVVSLTASPGIDQHLGFINACGPVAVSPCGVTITGDLTVLATFVPGGVLRWSKRLGGVPVAGVEAINDLVIDSLGNVVITGSVSAGTTINLGGGPLTATGAHDVLVAKFTAAGGLVWARLFGSGGAAVDDGTAVAIASNGDVLVGGRFEGTIAFDAFTAISAGGTDGFVARFAAATGAGVWLDGFGGAGTDEATGLAAAGTSIVVGLSSSDSNFSIGAGGPIDTTGGWEVAAALDGAGVAQWSERLVAAPDRNLAAVVRVLAAANGDAYILGYYGPTVPEIAPALPTPTVTTSFAARLLASDGSLVWARSYGGSAPGGQQNQVRFKSATLDAAGNLVATGWFDDTSGTGMENVGGMVAGGTTLVTQGASDMFVAFYDSTNGDHLGSFRFGSAAATGLEIPSAIASDPGNDVVVAGIYQTPTLVFGPDTLGGSSLDDVFIARFSPTGTARWGRSFVAAGDELATGIGISATSQISVGGFYLGDHTGANACFFDGTSFGGDDEGYVLTLSP